MTYTKDPVTVVYIYWDNEFLDHRWLLIDPIAGMVFNICHPSSNHTNFISSNEIQPLHVEVSGHEMHCLSSATLQR